MWSCIYSVLCNFHFFLIFNFYLSISSFWRQGFLGISSCPGTHSVDQALLGLRNLLASGSQVLRVKRPASPLSGPLCITFKQVFCVIHSCLHFQYTKKVKGLFFYHKVWLHPNALKFHLTNFQQIWYCQIQWDTFSPFLFNLFSINRFYLPLSSVFDSLIPGVYFSWPFGYSWFLKYFGNKYIYLWI